MRVSKFLFLVNLLVSTFNTVIAQSDHLEPTLGIFNIYDYQFEYYSNVRKILFDGLTDTPEIRFLKMPSFTPENVLDIEYDRTSNNYYLIFHICEKMIWDNDKWKKTKVIKVRKIITKKSVDLIKELFEKAIMQVQYPKEVTRGLDGENYYFSIYKNGIKSGKIWSPDQGTRMHRLVEIGNMLIELSKSNLEPVEFNATFKEDIIKLTNELK